MKIDIKLWGNTRVNVRVSNEGDDFWKTWSVTADVEAGVGTFRNLLRGVDLAYGNVYVVRA